jgi:hypothetical protein
MSEDRERKIEFLLRTAHDLRIDVIEMFHASGRGHIGGSLSIVEIMTALYFHIMRVDPKNPKWPDRDRLVLSKGHSSATWYAALAAKGFFPRSLLFTDYMKIGGKLQEHCDMNKVPGVEMSSGALGQGLSSQNLPESHSCRQTAIVGYHSTDPTSAITISNLRIPAASRLDREKDRERGTLSRRVNVCNR